MITQVKTCADAAVVLSVPEEPTKTLTSNGCSWPDYVIQLQEFAKQTMSPMGGLTDIRLVADGKPRAFLYSAARQRSITSFIQCGMPVGSH